MKRSGFTLIELLAVILLIATLIAFLMPAVQSVISNARVSEVRVEISQLEAAINDFKANFGTMPPSQIVLFENPSDWVSHPLGTINRARIRGIWSKFDFRQPRDFNADGDSDVSEMKTVPPSACYGEVKTPRRVCWPPPKAQGGTDSRIHNWVSA